MAKKLFLFVALPILTAVLFFAVTSFGLAASPPQIFSIDPTAGAYTGQSITISGAFFNIGSQNPNTVFFVQGGVTKSSLSAVSQDGEKIILSLPSNLSVGSATIQVSASGLFSSPFNYSVVSTPVLSVSGVNPSAVSVNIPSFEILGSGFPQASTYKLRFPSVGGNYWPNVLIWQNPVSIKVVGSPWPSFLTAGQTYQAVLEVMLADGRRESNQFGLPIALPGPVISQITPLSGQEAGKEIIISGVGFQVGAGNNAVDFLKLDGSKFKSAVPNSASVNEIKVNLPALTGLSSDLLAPNRIKIQVRTSFNWNTPSQSLDYSIIVPPVFGSISPTQGIADQTIIIQGSYFKSALNENRVFLTNKATGGGAYQAIPDQASPNELRFKLPKLIPGSYSVRVGTWWSSDWLKSVVSKDFEVIEPTLFVSLAAQPLAGSAPLPVNLTVVIGGSAEGTVNYTFWWNCANNSNSVDQVSRVCGDPNNPQFGVRSFAQQNVTVSTLKIVSHTYDKAGNYTAKVIVERGPLAVQMQSVPIKIEESANAGTQPPAAPTGVSPSGGNVSIKPTLSWQPVSGATRYDWWLSDKDTGAMMDSGTVVNQTTASPGSDLWPNMAYALAVTACSDQGGCSPYSYSDFKTVSQPTQPGQAGPGQSQPGQTGQTVQTGQTGQTGQSGSSSFCPTGAVCLDNPLKAGSIQDLIDKISRFIFIMALIIAPLMAIVAGVYYTTSGGDPQRISTAKNILLYTGIGLLVIFLSRVLVGVIKGAIGG